MAEQPDGFDDGLTRDIFFDSGSSRVKGSFNAMETKRLVFLIDQHLIDSPLAARLQAELLPYPADHDGSPLRSSITHEEAEEAVEALSAATEATDTRLASFRDDLAAALAVRSDD